MRVTYDSKAAVVFVPKSKKIQLWLESYGIFRIFLKTPFYLLFCFAYRTPMRIPGPEGIIHDHPLPPIRTYTGNIINLDLKKKMFHFRNL